MPEAALGFLLKYLREQRGLSYRELAKLADVDHAYIYRLETGDKESPSPDVLTKLVKALKPGKRETEMLHYLSEHSETASELVELTLKDESISCPHFKAVAGMAHRGKRPDYPVLIERVRRYMAEDEGDG
jgi:HTH-type transcriptional regulator, competence development regulator